MILMIMYDAHLIMSIREKVRAAIFLNANRFLVHILSVSPATRHVHSENDQDNWGPNQISENVMRNFICSCDNLRPTEILVEKKRE